jgi:transcriptional regulator GlxA family with amidase domain
MLEREGLSGGGGGALTSYFNGVFSIEGEDDQSTLGFLPPVIHLPAEQRYASVGLDETVRAIARELNNRQLGSDAILNHLAHLLFIQILRSYLQEHEDQQSGNWFTALCDPQIGQTLGLMHRQMAEPWSVASLAESVAMSRSAFASHFMQVVGQTPMAYLTDCRMKHARHLLQTTELPIKTIAMRVGYSTMPSFGTAFKRAHGMSPMAFRQQINQLDDMNTDE